MFVLHFTCNLSANPAGLNFKDVSKVCNPLTTMPAIPAAITLHLVTAPWLVSLPLYLPISLLFVHNTAAGVTTGKGQQDLIFFSSGFQSQSKSQVLKMNSHSLQSSYLCLSDRNLTNLALPLFLFSEHINQAPSSTIYALLHHLPETSFTKDPYTLHPQESR